LTNASSDPTIGTIDYTWVKPPHAKSTSQTKYKIGIGGEQTDFIPVDCWDYDSQAFYFRFRTQKAGLSNGFSEASCFNGTGYYVFATETGSSTNYPALDSPSSASDGNWSTYVWYEAFPPSAWMAYPDFSATDNASVSCAVWETAMEWDVCIPDWACSGYGACIGGHITCNAVTDTNICGESYTGNYSEFTPPFCPTGYASQYGAGDLASMIPDLFGNAFFMVLTLTGVIVIVTLVVWGVKKIRGEIK
jgi:hypothetical protein